MIFGSGFRLDTEIHMPMTLAADGVFLRTAAQLYFAPIFSGPPG
jgi:hypothetical protein